MLRKSLSVIRNMGGKISIRLRDKRSKKTKTSKQCTEAFDFNDYNVDNYYEHIGEGIVDRRNTDSEDGTYYEAVDQNVLERHPTSVRSRTSLESMTDSAFSDKSRESDKSIYNGQRRPFTKSKLPRERRHSVSVDDYGYYNLPTKKGADKLQHHHSKMTRVCELNESCSGSEWANVCEAPMERLVFLLDAYEPLIVKCLNVMDVIPHIPFIENTAPFREKHRESPQGAVTLLIQTLKESDEPGKWQSFLEALITAGYKYIAKLLREETEADHTITRKLLRLFTPELIRRIDPEEFSDHLLSVDDVIGDSDMQEIRCEKRNRGDDAASLMLLERLPRRLENWFEIFVDVLKKCQLEDLIDCFITEDISPGVANPRPKPSVSNSYYITPIDDESSTHETNPKLQTNIAEGIPATEPVTDKEIGFLRKERDCLIKKVEQLEKDNKTLSLQAEVWRLRKESDERENDESSTHETNPKLQTNIAEGIPATEPVTDKEKEFLRKERDCLIKKVEQLEKDNETLSLQVEVWRLQKELDERETDNLQVNQNSNNHLECIAKGVEDIKELLRQMCELQVQNAQTGSPVNNDAIQLVAGYPYLYLPTAHGFTPSSSYQVQSQDSAISMGYNSAHSDPCVYISDFSYEQ